MVVVFLYSVKVYRTNVQYIRMIWFAPNCHLTIGCQTVFPKKRRERRLLHPTTVSRKLSTNFGLALLARGGLAAAQLPPDVNLLSQHSSNSSVFLHSFMPAKPVSRESPVHSASRPDFAADRPDFEAAQLPPAASLL